MELITSTLAVVVASVMLDGIGSPSELLGHGLSSSNAVVSCISCDTAVLLAERLTVAAGIVELGFIRASELLSVPIIISRYHRPVW